MLQTKASGNGVCGVRGKNIKGADSNQQHFHSVCRQAVNASVKIARSYATY